MLAEAIFALLLYFTAVTGAASTSDIQNSLAEMRTTVSDLQRELTTLSTEVRREKDDREACKGLTDELHDVKVQYREFQDYRLKVDSDLSKVKNEFQAELQKMSSELSEMKSTFQSTIGQLQRLMSSLTPPNSNSTNSTNEVTITPEVGYPILIFATENAIKMLDLATKVVTTRVENVTNTRGITWDASKNMMYWATITYPESSLHRISITDFSSTPELVIEKGLVWPVTLVFDWITGNLYYVETKQRDSYAHIGFCNAEQRFCALLVYENMSNPIGLALHPNNGILFYTDVSTSPHVTKCMMDGSNCQKIVSSNLQLPYAITVDEKNSRIYFMDAGFERIESTTFEGTDRREVVSLSSYRPLGIATLEDQLYWCDRKSHKIYSCNKSDGSNVQNLTDDQQTYFYSMAIMNPSLQPKSRENACLSANCSHLCTLRLDNSFRCHCPVGTTLNTDNKSCIKCEGTISCLNSDCKLNCNKTLLLKTPHFLTCENGWKLPMDGSGLCEDINECETSSGNDCDHDCFNTIGSYQCTCRSNYTLNLDEKRCMRNGVPPVILTNWE